MIKSRFHICPARDISCEFDLVRQRQHVIISCNIYVKHMKAIFPTQVIGEVDEAGRRCFRHTIVDDHDVLIEVESARCCFCVE